MNIQGDLQSIPQTLETYQTSQTSTAAEKTSATDQASTPAPSVDQTHLSAAGNIVSQSVSQMDVRTDKVASVQAAIGNGSYYVDASQVAGKLIEHMLGEGK
jgi:negative regulator of flagellin synthesis FlgM